MTCSTSEVVDLDSRIQGALLPDTRVTWTEDDVVIDPSTSTWQVEAAPAGSSTKLWAKTTGITTAASEIVIGWAVGDMGALTPGDWWLELTGTVGGKPRKARLRITIEAEIA